MNNENFTIFNRARKIKQFDRAAKNFAQADFLHAESAQRLAGQFNGVIKKEFHNVLIIGGRGDMAGALGQNIKAKIIETDISFNFLSNPADNNKTCKIVADEEFLPFRNESFDLVISNLALHWVNDLPGSLIQIKRILKKGGFFCANIFGGRTLSELRQSLVNAEQKKHEISPRVSPFIDVKDGAALLQRVAFNEPVSVAEEITVKYDSTFALMHDLRQMGETNALSKLNPKYPGKDFFNDTEKIYQQNFNDDKGSLNATFEIITISGWKA